MERKNLKPLGEQALAVVLYELSQKIEDNNRLLKTLIQRIEALEANRVKEQKEAHDELLSETDAAIVDFIEKQGKATAEDVRARFNYKGRNAASARLNNLCRRGILTKKYAGKKVYFFLAR